MENTQNIPTNAQLGLPEPTYHKVGETVVKKGRDGKWQATTTLKLVNSERYIQVSTYVYAGGKITTSAQVCDYKSENGFSTFSYTLFQDPSKRLITEFGRGSEKTVHEQHVRGLQLLNSDDPAKW
jgi:hypothetical protein